MQIPASALPRAHYNQVLYEEDTFGPPERLDRRQRSSKRWESPSPRREDETRRACHASSQRHGGAAAAGPGASWRPKPERVFQSCCCTYWQSGESLRRCRRVAASLSMYHEWARIWPGPPRPSCSTVLSSPRRLPARRARPHSRRPFWVKSHRIGCLQLRFNATLLVGNLDPAALLLFSPLKSHHHHDDRNRIAGRLGNGASFLSPSPSGARLTARLGTKHDRDHCDCADPDHRTVASTRLKKLAFFNRITGIGT